MERRPHQPRGLSPPLTKMGVCMPRAEAMGGSRMTKLAVTRLRAMEKA